MMNKHDVMEIANTSSSAGNHWKNMLLKYAGKVFAPALSKMAWKKEWLALEMKLRVLPPAQRGRAANRLHQQELDQCYKVLFESAPLHFFAKLILKGANPLGVLERVHMQRLGHMMLDSEGSKMMVKLPSVLRSDLKEWAERSVEQSSYLKGWGSIPYQRDGALSRQDNALLVTFEWILSHIDVGDEGESHSWVAGLDYLKAVETVYPDAFDTLKSAPLCAIIAKEFVKADSKYLSGIEGDLLRPWKKKLHQQAYELFRFCTDRGWSMSQTDEYGLGVLHYACGQLLESRNLIIKEERLRLSGTITWGDLSGVLNIEPVKASRALLQMAFHFPGIDKDMKTPWGQTPLMSAAQSESPESIAFLLKQEVNVKAIDHFGNNALHYVSVSHFVSQGRPLDDASEMPASWELCTKALMESGVPLDQKNKEGYTPRDVWKNGASWLSQQLAPKAQPITPQRLEQWDRRVSDMEVRLMGHIVDGVSLNKSGEAMGSPLKGSVMRL